MISTKCVGPARPGEDEGEARRSDLLGGEIDDTNKSTVIKTQDARSAPGGGVVLLVHKTPLLLAAIA
jgi:hypothetical protein